MWGKFKGVGGISVEENFWRDKRVFSMDNLSAEYFPWKICLQSFFHGTSPFFVIFILNMEKQPNAQSKNNHFLVKYNSQKACMFCNYNSCLFSVTCGLKAARLCILWKNTLTEVWVEKTKLLLVAQIDSMSTAFWEADCKHKGSLLTTVTAILQGHFLGLYHDNKTEKISAFRTEPWWSPMLSAFLLNSE